MCVVLSRRFNNCTQMGGGLALAMVGMFLFVEHVVFYINQKIIIKWAQTFR